MNAVSPLCSMQVSIKKRMIYTSQTIAPPKHAPSRCGNTGPGIAPPETLRLQISARFVQCDSPGAAPLQGQHPESDPMQQKYSGPQTGLCDPFVIDPAEKNEALPAPGTEVTRETFKLHYSMKSDLDQSRKKFLRQFKFQPFKKCFRAECLTIFVPGDFNPSSPRRMFCSLQCFESHWRERLSKYLDILNLDKGQKRAALHGAG